VGFYALFAFLVSRTRNPADARRWKASIAVGLATYLLAVLLMAGVGVAVFVSHRSSAAALDTAMAVSALVQAGLMSLGLTSCIAMPFVFLSTFAAYWGFERSGDAWLDKTFGNPGVAGSRGAPR
jgi:hypothetical protein